MQDFKETIAAKKQKYQPGRTISPQTSHLMGQPSMRTVHKQSNNLTTSTTSNASFANLKVKLTARRHTQNVLFPKVRYKYKSCFNRNAEHVRSGSELSDKQINDLRERLAKD